MIYLIALMFVFLAGCEEYKNPKTVAMPMQARMYSTYSGKCKMVIDIQNNYSVTEMTIEGTCK